MRFCRLISVLAAWMHLVLPSAWAAGELHWRALSMVESGDRDGARGAAGEVSRYQISRQVWRAYGAGRDWTDQRQALGVAKRIQADRVEAFQRRHGRLPTAFEWYVLWNSPAQVQRPSNVVAKRAQRFCNVVEVLDKR